MSQWKQYSAQRLIFYFYISVTSGFISAVGHCFYFLQAAFSYKEKKGGGRAIRRLQVGSTN